MRKLNVRPNGIPVPAVALFALVVLAAGVAARGIAGPTLARVVWIVGSRSLVEEHAPGAMAGFGDAASAAGLRSFVVVDGTAAGIVEYADQLRPGLARFFDDLKGLGIHRLVLLSGDSIAHTATVAREVGITEVRGDLLPGDKVAAVRSLVVNGERVLMVGDGTNDAPALTTAHVGIALAGHGGGIVAEAADIVILGSDVTRVAEAIRIARRTLRVARESIWVGLGLSAVAMAAAAAGFIAPVPGAVLQEAIDVAVIINALRTGRAPRMNAVSGISPRALWSPLTDKQGARIHSPAMSREQMISGRAS